MKDLTTDRQWHIIRVATDDFQRRMQDTSRINDATADPVKTVSVHSRLALIHQVAKEFALNAVRSHENPDPMVEIDELTDPPLYEDGGDGPVSIRFSYSNCLPATS